jgi:type I restriction enzyme S subunit
MLMALKKYKLGDYIERSTANNRLMKYGEDLIVGVTNDGVFSVPKGNVNGVDLKPYKIVNNGDFVYNPSRFDLGSIAYRKEGLCIVSHLYQIFHLNEEGKKKIDPDWLFFYLRRDEFRREVTFRNFGSQRPEFDFNDLSEIELPLPSLDIQKQYATVYQAACDNMNVYQSRLDSLKTVCDGYIERLRTEIKPQKIGKFINVVTESNTDNKYSFVQGVESSGSFIETRANMYGVDTAKYTIVRKNFFAYNPSRINLGSIAMYTKEEPCVVSPMYQVFRINDYNSLLPQYLMLWLSRKEFRRSTLFYAEGSVRDTFDMNLMCDVEIPIPSINIQQDIVNIYQCYIERQRIAAQMKEQIKALCPVLIRGSLQE